MEVGGENGWVKAEGRRGADVGPRAGGGERRLWCIEPEPLRCRKGVCLGQWNLWKGLWTADGEAAEEEAER